MDKSKALPKDIKIHQEKPVSPIINAPETSALSESLPSFFKKTNAHASIVPSKQNDDFIDWVNENKEKLGW